MKNILNIWQGGNAIIFALPVLSHNNCQGRTLVRCEMEGDKLTISHECPINKIDQSLSCNCTKAAIYYFLELRPEVRFSDVVYKRKKIVLSPDWEQIKK